MKLYTTLFLAIALSFLAVPAHAGECPCPGSKGKDKTEDTSKPSE